MHILTEIHRNERINLRGKTAQRIAAMRSGIIHVGIGFIEWKGSG